MQICYSTFAIPNIRFTAFSVWSLQFSADDVKDSKMITKIWLLSILENSMNMDGFEMIAQGAEARIYKGTYLTRPTLIKERFVKKYRHPDLDTSLTKDRIRAECRAIVRAKSAGINTPALYLVNMERRCIYMEYIDNAITLKHFIDSHITGHSGVEDLIYFVRVGVAELIMRLHTHNIVHGDLTTSNILVRSNWKLPTNPKDTGVDNFILIDFGLARVEASAEDIGVDLYVFERSLLSAHSDLPDLFKGIYNDYKLSYTTDQLKEVISKFEDVKARGRKRLMVG